LVRTMCNLSVGLYEKGMERNSNQIVINLLRMHMGMDFIKKATGRSEEDIKKLAEENHLPV
ncbi:hypothetical protein, partial [Dialister succinatiphilus]|uniref:hypothetical protein n=1 Tax=Dialister succinatiphilus TaxID=487173 RepID=UPI004024DF19